MLQRTIRLLLPLALFCMSACQSLAEPKVTEKVLEGYYVFGVEVNTFQPCASDKVYWVIASDDVHKALEDQYENITTKPYEEVFVQLVGDFKGKANDGFAMDYDGQFRVGKVVSIQNKADRSCN